MFEAKDFPPLDRHLSSLKLIGVGRQPPITVDELNIGTALRTTSDRRHTVASSHENYVTGVTEIREFYRDVRHTNGR